MAAPFFFVLWRNEWTVSPGSACRRDTRSLWCRPGRRRQPPTQRFVSASSAEDLSLAASARASAPIASFTVLISDRSAAIFIRAIVVRNPVCAISIKSRVSRNGSGPKPCHRRSKERLRSKSRPGSWWTSSPSRRSRPSESAIPTSSQMCTDAEIAYFQNPCRGGYGLIRAGDAALAQGHAGRARRAIHVCHRGTDVFQLRRTAAARGRISFRW